VSRALAHRIFSFLGPKNSNRFFYFPIGKSAPTELFARSPLFTYRGIGLRDFARSVVERWSRIPETRYKSTLTLPLPCRDFLYRDFATRDIKQLVPDSRSRYAETLTHVRVDFSTSSPHRDFGVHGIANPNVNVSGLLTTKPR
jgi:hypothetical protein